MARQAQLNNRSTEQRLHSERVRAQLEDCGVTGYGKLKFVGMYLPQVIGEHENILAAVYGRYREAAGLLSLTEGWLIATDYRVIFIDHKPGYTGMEELGYDAVTGVQKTQAGLFSSVTLHSKIGDYTIRFANRRCVENFLHVIETRRLEKSRHGFFMQASLAKKKSRARISAPSPLAEPITEQAIEFLKSHSTGVFSSISREREVHGAVVYYLVGQDNRIYFLTKGETQKAHNVFANSTVALTVFDANPPQTLQVQGRAEIEPDQETKNWVFKQIFTPRKYSTGMTLPPVASLHDGSFIVIRITPLKAHYLDFTQPR